LKSLEATDLPNLADRSAIDEAPVRRLGLGIVGRWRGFRLRERQMHTEGRAASRL